MAIGEIGYDEQTALEDKYFRAQLELAKELALPIMIHTPHRDKHQGTLRSMAVALEHGIDPALVVIDHNNEETVRDVLDRGFWAAFSIYPHTKMGNERMVEIVRSYGAERIFCDSACDWGVSDPLAVPKTAELMRRGGISEADIRKVTYDNPLAAYGRAARSMSRTGSIPPPSISARCTWATRCCAAGKRRKSRRHRPRPAHALGDLKIV